MAAATAKITWSAGSRSRPKEESHTLATCYLNGERRFSVHQVFTILGVATENAVLQNVSHPAAKSAQLMGLSDAARAPTMLLEWPPGTGARQHHVLSDSGVLLALATSLRKEAGAPSSDQRLDMVASFIESAKPSLVMEESAWADAFARTPGKPGMLAALSKELHREGNEEALSRARALVFSGQKKQGTKPFSELDQFSESNRGLSDYQRGLLRDERKARLDNVGDALALIAVPRRAEGESASGQEDEDVTVEAADSFSFEQARARTTARLTQRAAARSALTACAARLRGAQASNSPEAHLLAAYHANDVPQFLRICEHPVLRRRLEASWWEAHHDAVLQASRRFTCMLMLMNLSRVKVRGVLQVGAQGLERALNMPKALRVLSTTSEAVAEWDKQTKVLGLLEPVGSYGADGTLQHASVAFDGLTIVDRYMGMRRVKLCTPHLQEQWRVRITGDAVEWSKRGGKKHRLSLCMGFISNVYLSSSQVDCFLLEYVDCNDKKLSTCEPHLQGTKKVIETLSDPTFTRPDPHDKSKAWPFGVVVAGDGGFRSMLAHKGGFDTARGGMPNSTATAEEYQNHELYIASSLWPPACALAKLALSQFTSEKAKWEHARAHFGQIQRPHGLLEDGGNMRCCSLHMVLTPGNRLRDDCCVSVRASGVDELASWGAELEAEGLSNDIVSTREKGALIIFNSAAGDSTRRFLRLGAGGFRRGGDGNGWGQRGHPHARLHAILAKVCEVGSMAMLAWVEEDADAFEASLPTLARNNLAYCALLKAAFNKHTGYPRSMANQPCVGHAFDAYDHGETYARQARAPPPPRHRRRLLERGPNAAAHSRV